MNTSMSNAGSPNNTGTTCQLDKAKFTAQCGKGEHHLSEVLVGFGREKARLEFIANVKFGLRPVFAYGAGV